MTLNDNPRVTAERRFKILSRRLDRFRRILARCPTPKDIDYDKYGWEYNKAAWAVHKARINRLRQLIETELNQVRRTLRTFGWNG